MLDAVFLAIFLADLIFNFLVEKPIEVNGFLHVENKLHRIALIYLKGDFTFDLVTWIPLFQIFLGTFSRASYLMLFKTLRIRSGMNTITASQFVKQLRQLSNWWVLKLIK